MAPNRREPVRRATQMPSVSPSAWRRFARAALVAVTACLVLITAWVTRTVADGSPDDVTPVRDSLAFLRVGLENGDGEAAQAHYPEGYFFSYAMYGLAWTELAAAGHVDPTTARTEAAWARDRLTSPAGRGAFSEGLSPSYGIFYAGWSLLLRAEVAALAVDLDPEELRGVRADADAVADAFAHALDVGAPPFLEAYPHQAWPVDSVVAIAALRRADRVTGQDHGSLIGRWVTRANDLVDPQTGLLAHRTDPGTGAVVEGSRGSSQSIIQRMWPTVDPASRPDVYRRFRAQFVRVRAGFVGVLEYPEGVEGKGDVDSGPLVLGFSPSASAVTIGAARANGDAHLARAIMQEADIFGVPLTIGGERRYALGVAPIGDAFLAWARAAPPAALAGYSAMGARWPLLLMPPWTMVAAGWFLVARGRRRRPRDERTTHLHLASGDRP